LVGWDRCDVDGLNVLKLMYLQEEKDSNNRAQDPFHPSSNNDEPSRANHVHTPLLRPFRDLKSSSSACYLALIFPTE